MHVLLNAGKQYGSKNNNIGVKINAYFNIIKYNIIVSRFVTIMRSRPFKFSCNLLHICAPVFLIIHSLVCTSNANHIKYLLPIPISFKSLVKR